MKKKIYKDKAVDDIYCQPMLSFERQERHGRILQCTAKKNFKMYLLSEEQLKKHCKNN